MQNNKLTSCFQDCVQNLGHWDGDRSPGHWSDAVASSLLYCFSSVLVLTVFIFVDVVWQWQTARTVFFVLFYFRFLFRFRCCNSSSNVHCYVYVSACDLHNSVFYPLFVCRKQITFAASIKSLCRIIVSFCWLSLSFDYSLRNVVSQMCPVLRKTCCMHH